MTENEPAAGNGAQTTTDVSALEEVLNQTTSALGQLARAELQTQIETAHQFPRSISRFLKEAGDMACADETTAASCFYNVPRAGKTVAGPSVRLAEICACAWGNIYHNARIIDDDGRMVTAQGMAHDLERNNRSTIEVKRRVTGKNGRRFGDDMVITTCNAALSIALRNAIFRVIPRALVDQLEQRCRKVVLGDEKSLQKKVADMLGYFAKKGVTEARILQSLELHGVEDIGAEELWKLKGTAAAIKDKQLTIDEAFPAGIPVKPGRGTESLAGRLAGQPSQAVEAPTDRGDSWEGDPPVKVFPDQSTE